MRKWREVFGSLVRRRPKAPIALEERAGKSCLGYGFDLLQNDGTQDFRWSRRFFGFFVEDAPLREVALVLVSNHETKLSVLINGLAVETGMLKVGEQMIAVRPPRVASAGVAHVAFTLERTWRAPDDPRKLGVRLLVLRVSTEREVVCYPAGALSHNATKDSWHRCRSHFGPGGNPGQQTEHNAKLNVEERTRQIDRVKSTPLRLYLETAWLCHLRCPSCFHAYLEPRARKAAIHFMSPFLFRKVAEQLFPGAMMVWYNGNGETLLHPNVEAILQTARDYSFTPALLTSGSLFTERNMRLLVEGGFFLTISVDSPEARDFERLRVGARYDKLVAALRHLVELNRSVKNPRFNLRIQCVAQQSNLHQLADLVRWAKHYGIGEVQFLPLQNFGHNLDYLEQAKLQHTPDDANHHMLAAVRAGTALGIRVRPVPPFNSSPAVEREFGAALEENLRASAEAGEFYRPLAAMAEHPANNPDRKCFLAWSECFIGVDGSVAPCDMYLDATTVGNLYDDDFWDIWNGPQMALMRRTVNHQPSGLCRFGTCMFRN